MKIGGIIASIALAATIAPAADPDYVDARACAACHAGIAQTYARSGMARSFSPPSGIGAVADYFHAPSDTHFAMISRGGRFFQRRWQIGFDGKQTNIEEKQIDYVMGSGNHVRTFLHRTASGELQQLPLAWYSERGGTWAMNPGYDQPNQPNSLRKISYECMFCHNAYPDIPAANAEPQAEPVFSGALPQGIDCQRCHGPGRRHVEAARMPGSTAEAIRAAIVNPARLPADRQMEVCAQCHLETTSFPFPHSIVKYDRAPFSYRAGEPLSDFMLFFDHPGDTDRFQIVSAVYRLKMSQCFLKGGVKCTTCHDPHYADHGGAAPKAAPRYSAICRQCHSALDARVKSGRHTASDDCTGCHMPSRRTDDVIHAAMTDHYIQRRKPDRDLLAAIPEPHGPHLIYHGEVFPYDESQFLRTPENELYLALAQVLEGNNIPDGIQQFNDLIGKYSPKQSEFLVALGDALVKAGEPARAVPIYNDALSLRHSFAAGMGLGNANEKLGDLLASEQSFRKAIELSPGAPGSDPAVWRRLGEVEIKLGRSIDARAALKKSLDLDPESPESNYALGTTFAADADPARAEASYREAIRLQPDYSAARMNLAILLFRENRREEADAQFKSALRYHADYALGHYNYALMLIAVNRREEARRQMQSAVDGAASLDAKTREEARQLLADLER